MNESLKPTSESDTLLEMSGVCSGYGKMEILHDLDITVGRAEIVSIIGPNGAGKSTALKTIMGYLSPTRGKVTFQGNDITGLRTDLVLREGIAYVPQGRIVFTDMTVLENLEMGAYIKRDKEGFRKSLNRVYNLFPRLSERRRQKAGSMSGGEQQMLAIGRALMVDPELILFDEPSLGLAPLFVKTIFEIILELSSMGMTMIIVEQNAARALEISHRGYVLELGRNRFEDTGRSLLSNDEVKRLYLGG